MYAKMFTFKATQFDWVSKKYLIKNVKNAKEKVNNNLDR